MAPHVLPSGCSRATGDVSRLLRRDPFAGEPPRCVRARLFRYRFTTRPERRATGAWWSRRPVRVFAGPASLRAG